MAGPVMLTRSLSRRSCRQFAAFFRKWLEEQGADLSRFRLRFIAEVALYKEFKEEFAGSGGQQHGVGLIDAETEGEFRACLVAKGSLMAREAL